MKYDDNAHEKVKNKHTYPQLQIVMIGHFLVADLMRMVKRDSELFKILRKKYAKGELLFEKRLITKFNMSLNLPVFVIINGKIFRLQLKFIDTVALHGNSSYKNAAELVGLPLPHKDLMNEHKANMGSAYLDLYLDFFKYAIGDLDADLILMETINLIGKLREEFGLLPLNRKLSIGSIVNQFRTDLIFKDFNIDNPDELPEQREDFFKNKTYKASAEYLINKLDEDNAIWKLGKCVGGLCRNNKPKDTTISGVLVILIWAVLMEQACQHYIILMEFQYYWMQ